MSGLLEGVVGGVRRREQGSLIRGYLFPNNRVSVKATHTGAKRPSPNKQDETVRKIGSTKYTHTNNRKNKPAQKPAGLSGLNCPKPKPKQETGATNQTTLNKAEKGIGGSH